jgi:hypothetical protein
MFKRSMISSIGLLLFAGFILAQAGATHLMGTVTAIKPDTVTGRQVRNGHAGKDDEVHERRQTS